MLRGTRSSDATTRSVHHHLVILSSLGSTSDFYLVMLQGQRRMNLGYSHLSRRVSNLHHSDDVLFPFALIGDGEWSSHRIERIGGSRFPWVLPDQLTRRGDEHRNALGKPSTAF